MIGEKFSDENEEENDDLWEDFVDDNTLTNNMINIENCELLEEVIVQNIKELSFPEFASNCNNILFKKTMSLFFNEYFKSFDKMTSSLLTLLPFLNYPINEFSFNILQSFIKLSSQYHFFVIFVQEKVKDENNNNNNNPIIYLELLVHKNNSMKILEIIKDFNNNLSYSDFLLFTSVDTVQNRITNISSSSSSSFFFFFFILFFFFFFFLFFYFFLTVFMKNILVLMNFKRLPI
jgi:hypothetical protein